MRRALAWWLEHTGLAFGAFGLCLSVMALSLRPRRLARVSEVEFRAAPVAELPRESVIVSPAVWLPGLKLHAAFHRGEEARA